MNAKETKRQMVGTCLGLIRYIFVKKILSQGWPQKEKHESVFRKVLLHEAVLAQDCKAGFTNNHLHNISVNIEVPEYVAKRYSKDRHSIEAEAFSYWHKGDKSWR